MSPASDATTLPTSPLRLGTRASQLALAQSGQVAEALRRAHRGLQVELVPITTRGDTTPGDLAKIGGKGLFTEELEAGLLDGSIDLAVHSLKDLPVTVADGLSIAAYPRRVDPRDSLVSAVGSHLGDLPMGSTLLTGSLRRGAQILRHRIDFKVESIRGNVDTRLRKWRESGAAGVILAAAGLARLNLCDLPAYPLPTEQMLPAPGQGILALQVLRKGRATPFCRALDHAETRLEADLERYLVRAFGGDCTLPLAAFAEPTEDGQTRLRGLLSTADGKRAAVGEVRGTAGEDLARACVDAMRADGADRVLAAL